MLPESEAELPAFKLPSDVTPGPFTGADLILFSGEITGWMEAGWFSQQNGGDAAMCKQLL